MPRRRRVDTGILKGHYKSKRTFYPEIVAKFNFELTDTTANDLPDILWPVILTHLYGHKAIALLRETQDLVISTVPNYIRENSASAVDGRLSSLEAFGRDSRRPIIQALQSSSLPSRVFPVELRGVLSVFENTPGDWITIDPWQHSAVPSPGESLDLLLDAFGLAMVDSHRNALAKSPAVIWKARIGKLIVKEGTARELIDYPDNPELRSNTDAFIRSIFGGLSAMDKENSTTANRDAWSHRFWLQCWQMTDCLQKSAPSVHSDGSSQSRETSPDNSEVLDVNGEEIQSASEDYSRLLGQEFSTFMNDTVTADKALDPADIDRLEVVTGLVYRIFRNLLVAFKSPYLWNSEHGSGIVRMLFETEISLLWLRANVDNGSYRKYQSYGKGKGKLYRMHLERLFEQSAGTPHESIASIIAQAIREEETTVSEQFQEISLDSTFAGISLRRMAEEVGQLDHYRYVYQPSSGATHGEWWTIETSIMDRCLNPLHRFHLIPSRDIRPDIKLHFPALALNYFMDILAVASASLALGGDNTDHESEATED